MATVNGKVKSQKPTSVHIDSIWPSPENDELYGAVDPTDNDLINLANDIARAGIREPLQISQDGYIVSGHRRYAAAQLAGLDTVPVVRLDIRRLDHMPIEWQKVLRAHNHQRVKNSHVRMKEAVLDIDPDIAHFELIRDRDLRDRDASPEIQIRGARQRCAISERKQEMLQACIAVVERLRPYWPLSDRFIHYHLLNAPPRRNTSSGPQGSMYRNDEKSWNDLTNMLTRARLAGYIPWDAITDSTRPVSGLNYSKDAAEFFDLEAHSFLRGYRRDLLQSQPDHIELIIEKMTLASIFESVAKKYTLPTLIGRGYCSINPRYEIVQRYKRSGKDRLVLLIAADFDPDGESIAESFARSIRDDFGIYQVRASKILLRKDQVEEWNLHENSNGMDAKPNSKQIKRFIELYGKNQRAYELESVPIELMQQTTVEAIEGALDLDKFAEELEREKEDAIRLAAMKRVAIEAFRGMN